MGTITSETVWNIARPAPASIYAALSEYSPVTAQMLFNRGITDRQSATAFLDPVYARDIHDPQQLSGVSDAVAELSRSIAAKERIIVHGDYDADGLTATAILTDALQRLGADVGSFIPSRYAEGYGVAPSTLAKLRDSGAQLVVTVDCGISSAAEIATARKAGLKVIVTDHHAPPQDVPKAEAVINPNLPGDPYPNKALTGAGVAFKLAQALFTEHMADRKRREAAEKWLLDLVAIGTVADLAELRGENRALVKYGLRVLAQTRRPGLRELMKAARVDSHRLSSRSLGYAIGPRLNSPGRLGHASEALELLTTEDSERSTQLAALLEQTNRERQQLTADAVAEAASRLGTPTDQDRIVILEGPWKSGVVGLIAGQLARDWSRPAVVIERGETISRGSVRSIPGFHVAEALQAHAALLETYGGHAQAGGFSIKTVHLDEFQDRLKNFAFGSLEPEQLLPVLDVEASLKPDELGWPLLEQIERFEPFGNGNPRPNLLLENVTVRSAATVGAEQAHLKLRLDGAGQRFNAIGFSLGERISELEPGAGVDLVGWPVSNDFNGQRNLEWHVVDFRRA